MLIAEAVGQALADLGVRDAFGLLGSGNFVVTKAMVDAGVRFVAARHENAAVSMADAYARVSGRPGVVTVHQGPGLTNGMTALTEAAKARTPLLLIAADTSATARQSNFRIDQAGLAGAVGAVAARAHSAESALDDLGRAWASAVVDRRAVLFGFPLDVQAAQAPSFEVAPPVVPEPLAPSMEDVRRLADLVAESRAPAIVAGRGAVLANAGPALEALGDRIGALMATSANGHGLFAENPWSLRISGGFASPTFVRLLRDSDLLLAFGASLNMWTTRHGGLLSDGAHVAQVDVDRGAIGAHQRCDVGVVGDARLTAEALREELARLGHTRTGRRTGDIRTAIARGRWNDEPFEDASDGERIDPRALSIALEGLLPRERTVAVDSGHFMGWPAMYLTVPDAAGFVFTQSFQSVGLGLSSAIGAAVARRDRLTVACAGDGGALMAMGEFETLVRLKLPVLVVVYNDAAYGAEVHHFGPQGHAVDLVEFPDADIAGMARGLGADAATVRSPRDLEAVRSWLERRHGPFVVDAKVVPTVVGEWLEEAFRAH